MSLRTSVIFYRWLQMYVLQAWLIYLIVVVVVWILLQAIKPCHGLSQATKLFFALFIGLIVVLFCICGIDKYCPDDFFWFFLLLFVAILAPIIVGIAALWKSRQQTSLDCSETCHDGSPKIKRTYVCEGDQCYPIKTTIRSKNAETTIIHQ